MYTSLKPIKVREKLLNQGVRIFSPYIFSRIFQTKPDVTKYFLETQVEQGLFSRLKRGLYMLKTDRPDEKEIANALYQPSYVSFEYALAYYNMLPEMVYTITSATTKQTRTFDVDSLAYSYYSLKPELYTGYTLVKSERGSYLMADREKALTDYLYFVVLGRRPVNDRLSPVNVDRKKLMSYVALYKKDQITTLIDSMYATA